MDGVIVIDKPAGPTSHDIVQRVKRIIGAKKVGHLGTLDPAATGVLPLAINGATKLASNLAGKEKIYEFTLVLGEARDTDDDTGTTIAKGQVTDDITQRLKSILPKFTGNIMQRPPAYSAVRLNGLHAYQRAREKERPILSPRPVTIDSIKMIPEGRWTMDDGRWTARLRVECQTGTYIRSLARDIGEELGSFGHAKDIRRLKSGRWTIDMAVKMEDVENALKKASDAFLVDSPMF